MRTNKIRIIALIALALYVIFGAACRATEKPDQNASELPPANEESFEIAPSNINLAAPLVISDKPEDVELAADIDKIIESSEFKNARWGVYVVSLKDGRVLVGRDARKLFVPASLQKTLTSIVALDQIGAGFRWKTLIYAANQIGEDGVLSGDLTLYGEGAPDFAEDGLEKLVAQLQSKGLKSVRGDIIGDESFFKGETLGDGWAWNDLQWYYGAEASALTYRENEAGIYSENGRIISTTDFVSVEDDTTKAEEVQAVGVKREPGENKVYVWGGGGNVAARMAVENPALWSAKSLKEALEKKGITVEGKAKSVDWKSKNKMNPETSAELASIESQTLGEIVKKMNKHSVNLYAELILRTIGKKLGDAAPNENPRVQKLRGDDSAGTSVVAKWLTDNNVAAGEIKIHDGSGLSRLNLLTPESFGRALIYATQSKFSDVFINSLPIAGTDGTLSGRLRKYSGKIRAKTGSITYVNSLGGYARTENETLVFVIICNNETSKADGSKTIDAIAARLFDKSTNNKSIGKSVENRGK